MTQKPPIDRTTSRRERRAAARASESRTGRPPVAAPKRRSPLRSPIALFSGGALVVGLVVIGIALASSGQLGDQSVPKAPLSAIPDQSLWDGRALGKADAPVTIEAYEDFQCPACDVFSTQMQPELVKDYVVTGKVRLVYKDMIIIDRNGSTESLRAAVGARCAGDQGLFWPYHEWLFANQKGENQGHFSDAFLKAIAVAVGVPDMEKWAACTKDQAVADAAEAEKAEGTQRGVNGTPTLFVNGENVGFPAYLDLKAKIDAIVAGS